MYTVCAALLMGAGLVLAGNRDMGPEDPDFKENDGDLESDVNPLKAPEGNYVVAEEDGVYVLNRDTFAYFTKPKDLVLVEFYAPWCGHCKTLEPEYAKAAQKLRKNGLYLAKVDATKEGALAKEHFVQGFPTIILFRNGEKVEDYDGGRTSGEIVEYMERHADPNWAPPPSAVLTLSQDNFTKTAKGKDIMLVMFYAPWCKHCKQLEPEYEGAAVELKDWGITLAKVDGTKEKELADQYNIHGWPTLRLLRKGRIYDYNGPREKANIIEYMKLQHQSPSQEKTTFQGIMNNMDRLEATVVGFFKGHSDLYDEFIVAANEMRGNHKFLHTMDEKLAEQFGFPLDTVAVFQPEIYKSAYENQTYSLSKKSGTYKEIIQFVRKHSIPLVGQRTRTNMITKYGEKPLIVIYYDVNFNHQYVKDTQFIREKILSVAKHFVDSNLRFALSNEDEYEDELKALGLEDSGADVNVACYTDKQKFRMEPEEDFEAETLAIFVESLRLGKVKPYMKSMPIPKKQEGPVRQIVANNYDTEIHRVKKDAVVFFYAPWCGHCKEFDPVFKKVAKKMLKSNENIVFGKLDGSSNDIPYMFPPLKGFPSIFFISAYEKFDPIAYQGEDRSYKAIKDWINRHSSIFLTEEEKDGLEVYEDEELPKELPEEIQSYQDENIEDSITKKAEETTAGADEKPEHTEL